MSPTTDPAPIRHFCFLRQNGLEIRIQADTICDTTGYGTSFVLKRGGQPVGEVQGGTGTEIWAWWVEQSDTHGSTYCLDFKNAGVVRIRADQRAPSTSSPRDYCEVFSLDSQTVGTVYRPYSTWWIEDV